MAVVEVAFTPLPAHVRTARLVAVAVARRSGVADSLLDEVRLAVGEACSLAVEAHRQHCPAELVKLALSDTGGRFEVMVTDSAPAKPGLAVSSGAAAVEGAPAGQRVTDGDQGPRGERPAAGNGQTGLQDGFGLAVIAELADDVRISHTPAGVSVRMSWPASADGS
jgi:serine/threonine-protein kinase RsbW